MKEFVPIEKQSKKARYAFHKKRRGTWGAINPVTRKPPAPGAYKRKKIRRGDADEPSDADFLFVHILFESFTQPHCAFLRFIVYFRCLTMASHGGALVSTGLLGLGKRVVDLVGHLKKRETQVIAKPQLVAA